MLGRAVNSSSLDLVYRRPTSNHKLLSHPGGNPDYISNSQHPDVSGVTELVGTAATAEDAIAEGTAATIECAAPLVEFEEDTLLWIKARASRPYSVAYPL